MNDYPAVINLVVNNDLCTGCGICTYHCPSNAISMGWNIDGFSVPELTGNCDNDSACLSVCPFNPYPEKKSKTEDEISHIFLKEAGKEHKQVGKYAGIYAGYAEEFRLTSSSGGIGTFVLADLLDRGIVDHVFSVKSGEENGEEFYRYSVSNNKNELMASAETKYFPVTLSSVFSEIDDLKGKVAIVGVSCFIKAIRLAQISNPILKEKIPFLVGIICGGIKSSFFTEYLADSSGVKAVDISSPNYRVKDMASTAGDYSFSCSSLLDQKRHSIKMRTVGDMWGSGLFKANACDFCDDVTTELADISIGDAWIAPYIFDGKGTNVIITRSKIAETIIQNGIKSERLVIDSLSLESFVASQQGSFNHRQLGLPYRLKVAIKQGRIVPPKRFDKDINVPLDFKIVQYLRMKVRAKSFKVWVKSRNSKEFNSKMKLIRKTLTVATKLTHYRKTFFSSELFGAIKRKLKK